MKIREIAELPVHELIHPEGARLIMFGTMPTLLLPFGPREVAQAWGFPRYTTSRIWVKTWPKTDPEKMSLKSFPHGTGFEARGNPEILMIFKSRIKPPGMGNKNVPSSLIISPRREHSRKPDEVRDEILRIYPGPHLELFGRQQFEGWDTCGNERTKFNEAAE